MTDTPIQNPPSTPETKAARKNSDRITELEVRNTKPKDKPFKLTIGEGLYLLVNPNGTKYWRFKYRYAGKEKLLAMGVYPETSLKEARLKRTAARKTLEEGHDPAEVKKADALEKKAASKSSFECVAREWYTKQSNVWGKTHLTDVLRRLEKNIFPAIGHRPIGDIDAPELLETIGQIEARGAHDLAHRVLAVCGQVFRFGIATGRCKRNISADLRGSLTPHKANHQPAVKIEDLPELMISISTYDEIAGDKLTRLSLQLLAETFVRTSELIGSVWEEFDLEAAIWIIPANRMKMKKDHLVPLSRNALEILKELRFIGGGSRFVFPGRNRDKPISNNTMLFALYRLGYKGRMCGHGFRSLASTILNESNLFRPDAIERQLAHSEKDEVRGAYNRAEYLPERQKLMQWWSDYLADIQVKKARRTKAKAA